MRTKKLGSVARFGARYGSKAKAKVLAVEKVQRKAQKCPYCSRPRAKRLAPGIWECKKCNAKFANKAYKVK